LTVQRGRCEICGRTLYEHGRARIIEAARTSSGREPAEEFFSAMEVSRHRRDIQRLADAATLLEEYANEGTLERPRELNHLRYELWEIKPGDVRLPFYELADISHGLLVVRLTSGFLKTQRFTQQQHINWGLRVAREDGAQ
jgi:hypothetical protein